MVYDVGLAAELGSAAELAQDAPVRALQQWPGEGVPRIPRAWLMIARGAPWTGFRHPQRLDVRHQQIDR